MINKDIVFASANEEQDIEGRVWKPDNEEEIKGVIQISHGMAEHIGRYKEFASFMTSHNYVICGNDHRGHGMSNNGTFGYMGSCDGHINMMEDMHVLYLLIKPEYENVPYILLGHSMGSFLARNYSVKYGNGLDGIIYSGTSIAGKYIKPLILFCKLIIKIKGPKACGDFFENMLKYKKLKNLKPYKSELDWLTKDENLIRLTQKDKYFGHPFTYQGYLDLFKLFMEVSQDSWFEHTPKELPVLIFSGTNDPLGSFGKAVKTTYDKLKENCVKNVTLELYDGGRHEMLNEANRYEVYGNILKWLEKL